MSGTPENLKVGFVIDGQLPQWKRPWQIVRGCQSYSSVGEMRFGWLADHFQKEHPPRVCYTRYRPWQRYDAVIFLKSMNAACQQLATTLRAQGTRAIFDVNVDYFTPASGTFYYHGMAPTASQTEAAQRMAAVCDALIADSSHLATIGAQHHPRVRWISDNVDLSLVPARRKTTREGKLHLLWSGEAVKLFELLSIEDVLRKYADRIRLTLVTNSLSALDRWITPYQERFEKLLSVLEHEVVPFTDIPALLECYAGGGVFLSPRFLDNSYNWGHTEWKITLPMACGRFVLASPIPSYRDVAERSGGLGLRICETSADWEQRFEELLSGSFDPESEEDAAREVVAKHYSTPVVAAAHRDFVREVCAAPLTLTQPRSAARSS